MRRESCEEIGGATNETIGGATISRTPNNNNNTNRKNITAMNFESGNLYHIYNQGNNRQQLFFSRENYLFFLKKIKKHILPHADILAWCLMPNHFHLMVYVKDVIIANDALTHGVTTSHTPNSHYRDSLSQREAISKKRTFNDSIGYLIR